MLVTLSTDHYSSKVRKNQVTRSWSHNIARISIRLLGIGILGFQGSAWGACAGNTSVSTALVAAQTINTWLCSYSITNSGSISLTGAGGMAFANLENIDTFTNNGTISSSNVSNTYGLNNGGGFTISSLVNTGTISSGNVALRNAGNSTTTLLDNSGTISGGNKGIGNTSGTIITLLNSGTISSTAGTGVHIQTASGVASIGTITNTGSIVGATAGINNVNSTLGTLNNKQGAGNVNGALTYTGVLPTNYNIIIAGTTTYGKLAATAVTGATTFGISNLSTTNSSILNSTLSAVLSGVTSAQLGFGNATTYYSSSNDYWFTLTATDLVNNIWSLTVTCYGGGCGTTIDPGVTVSLGSLSPTSRPVLAGGTLLLSNGDTSSLAFSVTAASTIQNSTSGSATLSGVLSGAGSWTFNGSGTTVLSGVNTYSGGTTVSGGILQGNTLSLQGTIVNNSQVVFDQASQGSYAGVMSGTGSLTKQNAGTLILTGANTYSGGTTVSGGTLQGNTLSLQGAILNNSQVVFDQASQGSYAGVMSGTGALIKQNAGTLILTGANTYSGGTTVTGGTLSLSGGSPTGTGDVFVASAGTLMGTGAIAGNSIVSGVLKPGNSPGYLSFTQNLTLNSGSTYQQDIAGNVQANSATPVGASGYYSFVNVGSQLVINSGATLMPRLANLFSASESGYGSAIYVPALGDRFRMVTAAGGISGRFDTLIQPSELTSGTQFIAFYNVNGSNSLDLAVTPTSYSSTLSSSTTNAREVANVLDQILGINKTGTATAAQDSLLYAVAGQTAASLPGFAQSLSGEIHAASAATLPQAIQRVQQAVLARLGDFTMPPTQFNGAGSNPLSSGAITGNNPSGLPTANVSSNPAVNPNAANITSAAITDGRAWGEIAYQRGERSGNSGGNGFNNNLYQAVFGVDAYTNAALGLKLGGGLALSNTTVNATGGNSTIQQGALFVYGKMAVAQDYVLDGMVSLGLSSTNLSRSDVTGISNGFSNKSVMGNDVLVSAGLSRPFETSDVRITPYVRLTYQYVGQAAYDEGASAAALSVGRMNANGVRAVIGVGAGSLNKDPLKAGYTYRANVAIGADSQGLLNPTLNTTLGGYSSSVTTPTAGAGFVQAGLYGTVKVADSVYAYAGVSAEARTGQTLYGGSVGLRVAF